MLNIFSQYRLFLFSLILSLILFSQGLYPGVRDFGIYTNYGFISNTTDFRSLINIPRPDLPLTKSVQPGAFNLGILIDYNVIGNFFIGFRAGYNHYALDFQDFEPTTFSNEGQPVPGTIQHDLTTSFKNLSLDFSLGYNFLNNFDIQFGINTNSPINSHFNQSEQIIKPKNYQYLELVGDYSGSVPEAMDFVIMPYTRLRLNSEILSYKKWRLVPEIEYKWAINNLVSGLNWKYSSISLGLSVSYNFDNEKVSDYYDSVYVRDTITTFSMIEKDSEIKLLSRNVTKEKVHDTKMSYWQVIIREQYALFKHKPKSILNGELTTVFITKDFETTPKLELSYNKETSEVYYPEYSMQDGKKNYSNNFQNDLLTNNTIDIPNIRFLPQVISEAGLDKWEINIYLKDNLLKSITGKGDVPPEINFDLSDYVNSVNLEGKKLRFEFIISDLDRQTVSANKGEISIKGKKNNVHKTASKIIIIPDDFKNISEIQNNYLKIKSNSRAVIYYNNKNYSSQKFRIDEIKDGVLMMKSLKNLFHLSFHLMKYS